MHNVAATNILPMHFNNPRRALTETEIDHCELECGLKFPLPLRSSYLRSNGGQPEPYVFESNDLDTVVCDFLPLKSELVGDAELVGTALECYELLVRERGIVPMHFFPFAVEGGGDYFFVDTHKSDVRCCRFLDQGQTNKT